MRVYVSGTLADLARFAADRTVSGGARFVPADDSEESEYETLQAAAEDAATLVAPRGRRVVVVAEVPDPDADFALSEVVAVHADDAPVETAATPLPELGWYATQEIGDLVG